jgi:hypothetical protein
MDFTRYFDPLRPLRHFRPQTDDSSRYTLRQSSRVLSRQDSYHASRHAFCTELPTTKEVDGDAFEDIELQPHGVKIPDPAINTRLGRKKREVVSVLKWWREEYIYAFICVATAVGIFVLLKHYDNRLVPVNMFWGVQFDTLLIALVTMVRVSIKAFVEAAVSQGAWLWVAARSQRRCRHASRLKDFKMFDEASRGLKGSLILLWNFKFR